jgi:acyl carrier protein
VRRIVLETLARYAPEADLGTLPPDAALREELDLDSMDQLNFAIALHDRLGIDIPEADYTKLATLEQCVAYCTARLTASGGS